MVQAIRFGLVGVLNTAVTLAVIFVLMKGLRVHYALSNCIGYLLGFLNSFVLNKKWTFRSKGNVGIEGVLFVAVFGVCYLIQLGALVFLKETMSIKADYSQLLAMAVYTGFNFMLNKVITFKNR
jgi:putative flippase GtrA